MSIYCNNIFLMKRLYLAYSPYFVVKDAANIANPAIAGEEITVAVQMIDEFPVVMDTRMRALEFAQQCSFGVARVECTHYGIDQIIEKEGYTFYPVPGSGSGIGTAPSLCFLAAHKGPADLLDAFEDTCLYRLILT